MYPITYTLLIFVSVNYTHSYLSTWFHEFSNSDPCIENFFYERIWCMSLDVIHIDVIELVK